MRRYFPLFIFLTLFFIGPVYAQAQQYTCPMHPHYISDRPGTCPICGMDLVELETESSDAPMDMPEDEQKQGEKKILYWQAPMDPNYKSDKPGKSPMGMDLVPIYGEDTQTTTKRTGVTIDPETVQNTGIRSEQAQMASFGTLVRSYGDVSENIRLQSDVSSRVEGWIEDLNVKAEGDEVKEGDLLFTLYSPALISAQKDLISALGSGYQGRVDAAAKRLISLGMQKRAIGEVKKSGKAFDNVPFYADVNGLVSEVNVRQGSYAKPGMRLITVQSYDTVWIEVSVAEKDIPYITKDTKARVSLPALGIRDRGADIDYIYPTIDRTTRTGQVRLVLDNSEGRLKPGAYADVEFETDVRKRLSIPSDAILKSKDGDYVVLDEGRGRFQPVRILAGLTYKNRTEVLEGVSVQDKVVVSGQFLIDSESALRESFRKMQRMQTPLAALDVSDDQMAMIDHLVDAAIYLQKQLAEGQEPRPHMIMPALTLGDHFLPIFRGTKLQFILEDAEKALQNGQKNVTDEQWRGTLNDLVVSLKPWLMEGRPQYYKEKGVQFFMAHGADKYWLQLEGDAQNPYGEGHDVKIDWPEKVDIQMPEDQETSKETMSGGDHAHH